MNYSPDLAELLRDPSQVNEIPPQSIPAILTQLAALHNALAARLLVANENAEGHPEDRLLGIEEAAQRLGVSISWLYRRSSRLSFVVRMGRKLVFSLRGIERYIKQRAGRT
jgi:predicted DNA-binding transcriptional regulator AlpA